MAYQIITKNGKTLSYTNTKKSAVSKAKKHLKNKKPGSVVFVDKDAFHVVKSKTRIKRGKNKGKYPFKIFND